MCVFQDGRDHLFLVDTEPDTFASIKDYDCLCPILKTKDASKVAALAMLAKGFPRGGIVYDGELVLFRLELLDMMPAEQMKELILEACEVADELEKALTGKDDL